MNSNVMDEVLDKYQAAVSAWSGVMIKYGTWLLVLALISMVDLRHDGYAGRWY